MPSEGCGDVLLSPARTNGIPPNTAAGRPNSVLVSESLGASYPITRALTRWKPGILDTQAGRAMSLVDFRITCRLYSETTAHERGMFHYKSGPAGDDVSAADIDQDYVHFEPLLVK